MIKKIKSSLSKLIPKRFRRSRVVIPMVRLNGTIAASRGNLSLASINQLLEKAFAKPSTKAVALSINSPGGSPVQSALIHDRIRQLAAKNDIQVLVFCEDVAASGGYWLATAGDEIYANSSSIIGSIGVVAAGFGFVGAIDKLGIERRVYTQGKNKVILDPFQPEKKADIERLEHLHKDIHSQFINHVKTRREGKLPEDEGELFTGAFWTAAPALESGLIDGIGNMHAILQEKFGDGVEIKPYDRFPGLLARFGLARNHSNIADQLANTIESRSLWARYGL